MHFMLLLGYVQNVIRLFKERRLAYCLLIRLFIEHNCARGSNVSKRVVNGYKNDIKMSKNLISKETAR